MKATPNRLGGFDDKQAVLVSLVLTAAFLFVGELTLQFFNPDSTEFPPWVMLEIS